MSTTTLLEDALAPLDAARVLVGFSGGLDSTVLLHALAARRARLGSLRAIHVDHGLDPASSDWAAHCASTCASLGVPMVSRRVRVEADGQGPEAAAREARFAAFADVIEAGEVLVLAHHQDDQAETVLLRMLRGSASGGVAAMRADRPFATGRLQRPFLGLPRDVLREHARRHALDWIEDPSNQSGRFRRNVLRQSVLPLMETHWPGAAQALAGSARLLAEDALLLETECARRLADVLDAGGESLSVPALRALSPPWRSRAPRHWLQARGLPAGPAAAAARIDAELLSSRRDACARLQWPGVDLRRWRDSLFADAPSAAAPADWRSTWTGEDPLRLPDGSQLAWRDREDAPADPPADTAQALHALRERFGLLQLRPRAGGERMRLPGRSHRHQLKHLLQDLALPPWRRAELPLVFATDGDLLAAGDLLVGERLAAWQEDFGLRLSWTRPGRAIDPSPPRGRH